MPDNDEQLSALMTDQAEGFEAEGELLWVMQTKLPDGRWVIDNTPRQSRDEVTRIQAFHLNKDFDDHTLRVLKRTIVWTVDEVPGYGDGQTPPEHILARNEEITRRLLTEEESTQQSAE